MAISATGVNYSQEMALNKPRTLQGEIAALEREINQHRRDMQAVELEDGVAHGNISEWLITSGRTCSIASLPIFKSFIRFAMDNRAVARRQVVGS